MIHDQLREAYQRGAEPDGNGRHLPPDELRIDTLDIDVIKCHVDVELVPYYLDLTSSTDETLVYRLGKR